MSPTSKRDVGRLLQAHYRAERGAPDAAAKAATLKAVRAVATERPADASRDAVGAGAVSYTHLDVYKRQAPACSFLFWFSAILP